MSVEQAIIAKARPQMLAVRAKAIMEKEFSKGCHPGIIAKPVALEPPFNSITQASELLAGKTETDFNIEPLPPTDDLVRLQLWLSPEQKFSWLNSELFLKQLRAVSHRVAFEIVGNRKKIQMRFLIHRRDLPIIQTAFISQFERCEISPEFDDFFYRINSRIVE